MIDERARELLDGKNFATVATMRPEGRPQLAVTWVMTDGENLILNSSLENRWVQNLERDPRVTMTVADQGDPYVHVLIYGRVIDRSTEDAAETLNALSKKYLDVDEYPFHREHETRVTITIAPERVIYKG